MADDLAILDTTETHMPDERGAFVKHFQIRFKVGPDGPFTRSFPAATFNPDDARRQLEDFARELKTLRRA